MRNTRLSAALLALAVFAVVAADVRAMYDAKHGRWLQRDPIGTGDIVTYDQQGGPRITVAAAVSIPTRVVISNRAPVGRFIPHDPVVAQPDANRFVPRNSANKRVGIGQTGLENLYVDGMSLYEYVRSCPTALVDPMGLAMCGAFPCWPPEPSPDPPVRKGCCNGKTYDKCTQCCEDGKVVNKVEIWFCKRPLDAWYGGIFHLLDVDHCYICCGGANSNCFSFGPHNTAPGKIDPEGNPTGKCTRGYVCPHEKKGKCENPTTTKAYNARTYNCCNWMNDGFDPW